MNINIRLGFKKLYTVFFILVIGSCFAAILIPMQLNIQRNKTHHIQNEVNPFVADLNQLELLLTNSKLLMISWIYLPDNQNEKKQLVKLHNEDYPILKKRLLHDVKSQSISNDSFINLLLQIDTIFSVQRVVMIQLLSGIDDYSNPIKIFSSNESLTTEIYPRTIKAQRCLTELIAQNESDAVTLRKSMLLSFNIITVLAILVGSSFVLIIVFAGFYMYKTVTKPILQVRDILHVLSRGEEPLINIRSNELVIAEMVNAVQTLACNFSTTAQSATEIGKGNFNVKFSPLSEYDILGKALLSMRDSLKSYSEEMEQKVFDRTVLLQKQNELLNDQKLIIEDKNKSIISSITSAQRIQNALLPLNDTISKYLPDFFILYQPKDIVSGDFYWFTEKNNKIFVVVADCTGHGVPGAFMSMLGDAFLSHIIEVQGIVDADLILNQLHVAVRSALKQADTDNQDGMDIALCVIDKENQLLEFAGAKNPLFYFQNNNFYEIKADRISIGGYQHELIRTFTKNVIDISIPSTFYIFSDGFQDQFGGEKNHKLTKKGLKALLQTVQHENMPTQELLLNEFMHKWLNNTPQIDDILLFGFRI